MTYIVTVHNDYQGRVRVYGKHEGGRVFKRQGVLPNRSAVRAVITQELGDRVGDERIKVVPSTDVPRSIKELGGFIDLTV